MKSLGPQWNDSNVVIFLEYLFAVSFTLTRVVNMAQIGVGCVVFSETVELKIAIGALMTSIYSLQVYWFYKIIKALDKKKTSRNEKKQE